jgi:twinkle protein
LIGEIILSKLVQAKLPCPSCSSSDAYHLYDDGHGYCFSCRKYFGSDRIESDEAFTFEFLPWRSVPRESFEFYDCKTKIAPNGEPLAIGFKYPDATVKVRYLDRKEFLWDISKGHPKAGLFGMDLFSPGASKYVTITEGELDAISLNYALSQGKNMASSPVVSVRSASSAAADCSSVRQWLNSYERIYLCFDSDTAGREAEAAVARLFDYNKVFQVKLTRFKDPNEFLQHGESSELRNIWWRAKKYLPTTIISSFDDFRAALTKPTPPSAPFPWPTLQEWTGGIRRGESYLITALEGVGKTEIMHAIEHKLLKETDDNVGAIFLEEPQKRHFQAIAGLELGKPVHLPDQNIPDSEIADTLEEVVRVDGRLHVYTHYGSDDPDVLLDTIRFIVSTCNVPYVLLDHISMAVSGLGGESERTALDYIITRLEMMVVELNFALIFVSHVNDLGQTRGSRMISKVANTRIDLFRDAMADDELKKNTLDINISKNRFGGKTGKCCQLRFNPNTWSFSEIGNESVPDTLLHPLQDRSSERKSIKSGSLLSEPSF